MGITTLRLDPDGHYGRNGPRGKLSKIDISQDKVKGRNGPNIH